jgi:immunity protein 74 of polymorphic toxin system
MRLFRRHDDASPVRRFPDLKTDAARSHLRLELAGRSATVQAEAFLPGHGSPDFVVHRRQVAWDDGAPVEDGERDLIIETLLASAAERGLTVEIE